MSFLNPLTKKIGPSDVERLNAGDERAFALVYDALAPRLLKHANIRTSDEEAAKDLVHSVFLKLWEYIRGGGAVSHPQAFLYKSLHNAICDHYRLSSRTTDLPEDESAEPLREDPQITFEIDQKFAAVRVKKALDAISPSHKSILILRYMDELTMDELEEVTGKSKGALYVMLHRAVKDLGKSLVKEEDGGLIQ